MALQGIIAFLVLAAQAVDIFADTPQPFRVVWNYPDGICRALHMNFELDKFHIDHNEHKFVEDTIAIFYSDRAGKWPYIDFKDGNKYIDGGLPKDVDLPSHLEALTTTVSDSIKPDAHGFGVIDMENWRPVYITNYGRFTPYKRIFADYVTKKYPDMPRQQLRRTIVKEWQESSLSLMVESLEAVKKVRPDEHWGYYGYPQYVTKVHNEKLGELWKTITAYYPSIYIKKHDESVEAKRQHIKEDLAESFKIRALYGNPSDPIMPYTAAQYRDLGMFHGDWLRMEIRLPIEMGIDGLILWASSDEFNPPTQKCTEENEFVHTTLGPLIEEELVRMTKCSEQLCAGKGRCVKKEYADEFPYLKTRGVPEDVLGTAEPSGVEAVPMDEVDDEFSSDFICQCYDGSAGDRCTDAYEL